MIGDCRMHIENAEKTVGPEAIQLFERFMDRKFPKDYRNFLLKNNGGRPVPDCFNFFDGQSGSIVNQFYKIISKDDYDDLLKTIRIFDQRIPSDFVPIADDPYGNQICIAISGPNYGKIYFWDHEFETDDEVLPTMDNMTLIAQSFANFLEALYKLR